MTDKVRKFDEAVDLILNIRDLDIKNPNNRIEQEHMFRILYTMIDTKYVSSRQEIWKWILKIVAWPLLIAMRWIR